MHPRVVKTIASSTPARAGEASGRIGSGEPGRGQALLHRYGPDRRSASGLKEADVCGDLATALAQSQALYARQIALATLTGRPDLAAAYQAQAARERLDLLQGWLTARHAGHPSLALLRAAARAESRSRYSSRGRRAHRELLPDQARTPQPTNEADAIE